MQAATDAVKSALGQEDAPKGQFERGYKPNAAAEKEAQGGEDSRPPGKQYALVDKPVDDVYADGTPYVGTDKLKGKVMLITGGDSGIGRSTAILAAIEGANVSIVYLPEEQKDADDVKTYIAAKAPQSEVLLLPLDLKSESNCKLAVEKTVEKFGRLDSVFLNAAQQLENHDITTLDSKQWEDTFQVNIFHAFYVARHSVPHLTKNPSSTIVINASVNAFIGRPDLLDYTSTKGALVSFMRGLANQQASKGLRVNAVAPGPIVTPLVSSTFSKENIEGVNSGPMARPGQPVEVATAVMFLASKDSSYVTGNTLHVNGGMYVH